MDLKRPLKLQIMYDDKEDKRLMEMGINVNAKPFLQTVIFYSVDTLTSVHFDDDSKRRASISSGGQDYICELTMEEVERLLILNYE